MRRPFVTPIVAAAVVLTGCGGLAETAAAVVDGRKIEDAVVSRQLRFILSDPRLAEQLPGESDPGQRQELAREFLTFLIHQELIAEYARDHGIVIDMEEVDERLVAEFIDAEGQAAFLSRLESAGATQADVRNLIRHQLLRQRVIDAVATERLSDERLLEEYESRVREFTTVDLSHILLNDEAQAETLADRATPRNFAALARRFSKDPSSAEREGDLGTHRVAELVESVADAAMETGVGQIVGPVESEFGFHVLWVKARETTRFEVVRPQLLQELQGPVFAEWLMERAKQAEIRVNPRYGLFDATTGEVVPAGPTTPEPDRVQLTP